MEKLADTATLAIPRSGQRPELRAGGVLLLVMVILVTFSVLAIVLMRFSDVNSRDVVFAQQSDQAFSLAEAGMYHAIAVLRSDSAYRAAPSPVIATLGSGSYTVAVTCTYADPQGTNLDYSLISHGTAGRASRTLGRNVHIEITTPPDALMSGGNISILGTNSTIIGNIVAVGTVTNTGDVYGTIQSSNSVALTSGATASNVLTSGSLILTNQSSVYGSVTAGVNVVIYTNSFVTNGDITAGGSVTSRNGKVYGDITTAGNVAITNVGKLVTNVYGDVTAGGKITVSTNGFITGNSNAFASVGIPTPTVDTSLTDWSDQKATFDALIAIATTSKTTSISFPYSLSNRTVFVKSTSIQNAVGKPLIGPGTLVVSGDITLFAISNGVTVVSGGKLQLGTGGTPDTNFPIINSTFYSGSTDRMWLDNPYLSFSNSLLYSAGDLDARAFDILDADTVFLALGSMTFGDGKPRTFNIQGQLQAGSFIYADSFTDFNVTYSQNLPWQSTVRQRVRVTPSITNSWQDLGY